MTLQAIEKAALSQHLSIFGMLHPAPTDVAPEIKTIVLLGPSEPGFWAYFTTSEEFLDGRADPLDRWSERVIGALAGTANARAFYPFGGPPYQPFIKWAKASGRAHVSPVGLLVHDRAGLWLSYRGALGLRQRLPLPSAAPSPCLACDMRPCVKSCPVGALRPEFYDVAACKADLESAGNTCMTTGCAARRACPVSRRYGRIEAQSAFHMEAFK